MLGGIAEATMFATYKRYKDGKTHTYYAVVERRTKADRGHVVAYLGD